VSRYDEIGHTYTATRRADPRFAAAIRDALTTTGATGLADCVSCAGSRAAGS
jgi:hypothetical protein